MCVCIWLMPGFMWMLVEGLQISTLFLGKAARVIMCLACEFIHINCDFDRLQTYTLKTFILSASRKTVTEGGSNSGERDGEKVSCVCAKGRKKSWETCRSWFY